MSADRLTPEREAFFRAWYVGTANEIPVATELLAELDALRAEVRAPGENHEETARLLAAWSIGAGSTEDIAKEIAHALAAAAHSAIETYRGSPEAMAPFWDIVAEVERICGNEEGQIHSSIMAIIERTIRVALERRDVEFDQMFDKLRALEAEQPALHAEIARLKALLRAGA